MGQKCNFEAKFPPNQGMYGLTNITSYLWHFLRFSKKSKKIVRADFSQSPKNPHFLAKNGDFSLNGDYGA